MKCFATLNSACNVAPFIQEVLQHSLGDLYKTTNGKVTTPLLPHQSNIDEIYGPDVKTKLQKSHYDNQICNR